MSKSATIAKNPPKISPRLIAYLIVLGAIITPVGIGGNFGPEQLRFILTATISAPAGGDLSIKIELGPKCAFEPLASVHRGARMLGLIWGTNIPISLSFFMNAIENVPMTV